MGASRRLADSVDQTLRRWISGRLGRPCAPLDVETLRSLHRRFRGLSPDAQNEFTRQFLGIIRRAGPLRTSPREAPGFGPVARRGIGGGQVIYAVAIPNTLDVTVELARSADGLRVVDVRQDPGGKSINVAKTLAAFGRRVQLLAVAGSGDVGCALARRLRKLGLFRVALVRSRADTRLYPVFVARDERLELRFAAPGGGLERPEIERLFRRLTRNLRAAPRGSFLVTGGRLPPGADVSLYAEVIRAANAAGMKVAFDVHASLQPGQIGAILQSRPYLIKPNVEEFALIVGKDAAMLRGHLQRLVREARRLISLRGIELIAVSLGEQGAVLVTRERAYQASAPPIAFQSSVGAGDAMTAGLVHKLAGRAPLAEALRFAVAAGTASTARPGTSAATMEEAEALSARVVVRAVPPLAS